MKDFLNRIPDFTRPFGSLSGVNLDQINPSEFRVVTTNDTPHDVDDPCGLQRDIELIKSGVLQSNNFIYIASGPFPVLCAAGIIGQYKNAGLEPPLVVVDRAYDTTKTNVNRILHISNNQVVATIESDLFQGLEVGKYYDQANNYFAKTFSEQEIGQMSPSKKQELIAVFAKLEAFRDKYNIQDAETLDQTLANPNVSTIIWRVMSGVEYVPSNPVVLDKIANLTMQGKVENGELSGFNYGSTVEKKRLLEFIKKIPTICLVSVSDHNLLFGKYPQEAGEYAQLNNQNAKNYIISQQIAWCLVPGQPSKEGLQPQLSNPFQLLPAAEFPLNRHYKFGQQFGLERFLNVISYPDPAVKDQLREKIIGISNKFFEEIVKAIATNRDFTNVTIPQCQQAIANFVNKQELDPALIKALKDQANDLFPQYQDQVFQAVSDLGCNFKTVIYDLVAQCAPQAILEVQEFIDSLTEEKKQTLSHQNFQEIFATEVNVENSKTARATYVPQNIDKFFDDNNVSQELRNKFFECLQREMSRVIEVVNPLLASQQNQSPRSNFVVRSNNSQVLQTDAAFKGVIK